MSKEISFNGIEFKDQEQAQKRIDEIQDEFNKLIDSNKRLLGQVNEDVELLNKQSETISKLTEALEFSNNFAQTVMKALTVAGQDPISAAQKINQAISDYKSSIPNFELTSKLSNETKD